MTFGTNKIQSKLKETRKGKPVPLPVGNSRPAVTGQLQGPEPLGNNRPGEDEARFPAAPQPSCQDRAGAQCIRPPPGGVSSPGASGLPAGVGGSWWLSAEQPLLADSGSRAGSAGRRGDGG